MMDFVILTGAFALGILIAMGVAFAVMLQPRVMKWYAKFIIKQMQRFDEIVDQELES